MSSASDRPPSTNSGAEDQEEMLESLTGLHLKGFKDCPGDRNANTPSSANDSLPTPRDMKIGLAVPASYWKVWIAENPARTPNPPNAPLLKDYDSFTEGTGHESFDFPLIPDNDEDSYQPLFFHPKETFPLVDVPDLNELDVSNLAELDATPSFTEINEAVLAWIDSLSETPEEPSTPSTPLTPEEPPSPSTPSRKRRRSFTQDGEEVEQRRIRVWSPTIDSPLPLQPRIQEDFSDNLDFREEPEAPG